MKNYLFILGSAVLGLLASCSSDDNSDSGDDGSSPVGSYNLVSVKTSKPIDADKDGVFDDTELLPFITCTSTIALNENQTFAWNRVQVYVMSDISDDFICYNDSDVGVYVLTGNALQLNGDHNGLNMLNKDGDKITDSSSSYFYTSNENYEQLTVTYTYQK